MTSRIYSPVADVSALLFHPLPTNKPTAIARAIRVNKTFVFHGANGNVYSTQVKSKAYYTTGAGLDDTLTGCKRLGLLSAEALKNHKAAVQAREQRREARWSAGNLEDAAKALGVPLSITQKRAISKAKEAAEVDD